MGRAAQWLTSALPLAMAVFEIAAGCAFAFRKPTAGWVALTGYIVAAASLLSFVMFADRPSDIGTLALVATVVETLGLPIILVVALAIGKPPGSSPRREVGVMLIVFAISILLGTAVRVIEHVRVVSRGKRPDDPRGACPNFGPGGRPFPMGSGVFFQPFPARGYRVVFAGTPPKGGLSFGFLGGKSPPNFPKNERWGVEKWEYFFLKNSSAPLCSKMGGGKNYPLG